MDCLNPACPSPLNPGNARFCQSCGVKLEPPYLFRQRYRVQRLLGQGAFGRTYLMEDSECLNRPCVLKKFLAPANGAALAKATELFVQEAQRLYELDNPQIPRLYASFEDNHSLYLVQQYIAGANLYDECLKRRWFLEEEVWDLLQSLLPVLQYIHEKGVLHRDIKPENIMRKTDVGGAAEFVLIDFGGAKQITGTQATPGTQIFTLGYAATEQIMGRPVPASDIYALGATCARLLTGSFPLEQADGTIGDELFDALTLRWRWRELLQAQSRTASDRLGAVLETMLQPLARDRYQSAEEALQALERKAVPTVFTPAANGERFSFEVIAVDKQGKIKNRRPGQANYSTEEIAAGVRLEMVAIPEGNFLMGSPETENGSHNSESPQHRVTIQPFYLGKYAVTQAQWQAVAALPKVKIDLEPSPSRFQGANRPVERVSWWDAEEFCQRLSQHTGQEYRLPSEAEWEYACRAGTITAFHFGETITPELVNYNGNSTDDTVPNGKYRKETVEVGSLPPNKFGLYEMHGNVWEWCADDWHENYHGAPEDEVIWRVSDKIAPKLLRGGSWFSNPLDCRSAVRNNFNPNNFYYHFGFRVAFLPM